MQATLAYALACAVPYLTICMALYGYTNLSAWVIIKESRANEGRTMTNRADDAAYFEDPIVTAEQLKQIVDAWIVYERLYNSQNEQIGTVVRGWVAGPIATAVTTAWEDYALKGDRLFLDPVDVADDKAIAEACSGLRAQPVYFSQEN
jgi:hypothetical protein